MAFVSLIACGGIMLVVVMRMQPIDSQESKKVKKVIYTSEKINEIINRLSDYEESPKEKGKLIIKLMRCGYITVHKILNEGNNYNDEIQKESFTNYLTKERISKLKKVGFDE